MDIRAIPPASWPRWMNWHRLTIDAKKKAIEQRIGEILTAMAKARHELTDWQRVHLRDALTCTAHGLFDLARADADKALATDISPQPWGSGEPPDVGEVTIDSLGAALAALQQLPPQEPAVFTLRR